MSSGVSRPRQKKKHYHPMGSKPLQRCDSNILNELPDEILSFTLSFLPIREAARTSILSRRWRYIWKTSVKFSRILNLDVVAMRGSKYDRDDLFCPLKKNKNQPLLKERHKFVRWVDMILKLGYSPMIDSFRLCFDMNKAFAHVIDQWISMAVAKKVQNINIDLSNFYGPKEEKLYMFPYSLFTKESGPLVKVFCLNSCILGPLDFSSFSSLVYLRFEDIDISQEIITKVLCHCPNLETLWLQNCESLPSLEISGPSLKLKFLSIINCYCERRIKIDARNLTRFYYMGGSVKFSFLNVPKLGNVAIHFSLGPKLWSNLCCALPILFSNIPKLELLFLTVEFYKDNRVLSQLPLFANLKKLVLSITCSKRLLWPLIPLLQATPLLHTLELHLFYYDSNWEVVQRPSDSPRLDLQEIMLTGFRSTTHEIEFINYLVRNSKALKKITIDCETKMFDIESQIFYFREYSSKEFSKEEVVELRAEDEKIKARARQQLGKIVCPGVELNFV